MDGIEFEWHDKKEADNRRKHRVSFDEAVTVFADPLARRFDDPDHSEAEQRFLLIGQSARSRVLIVSYTIRGNRVRIISARKATQGERDGYEEG